MKATLTSIKPMSLMIASVAIVSSAVVGVSLASSGKAGFTLTAGPTTVTVTQGQVANFAISETANNGFSGAVALSVSGLPSAANASFSPNPIVKGSTSSTLAVYTSAAAPTGPGGVTLTITGASGSITSPPVTVKLVVNAAPPAAFTLSGSGTQTALPGDAATFTVTAARPSPPTYSGPISLSVASGLPAGATASFSQPTLNGPTLSSNLTVSTKNNSPTGIYTVVVNGTGSGQTQSTSVTLNLTGSGKTFAVSLAKPISDLSPDVTRSIDLLLSNPNSQPMQVTNLTVAIQSVVKGPGAPSGLSCGVADYTLTQYAGSYPVIQPGPSVSLSSVLPAGSTLPTIKMKDADADQDGCKGASINLVFSGAGQG